MNETAVTGLSCSVLYKKIGGAAFCALLAMFALPLQAAPHKAASEASHTPEWVYPVIPGIGGVHPRADLPVRPDPKVNYKIFVDVISSDRDPSGKFQSLMRLARLVNLMAYTKVPPEHVNIVALLDEQVGFAAGTDAFYRKAFGSDNPNLPLIHALKKAGVKLLICAQGLAQSHIADSAIDPAVTITLSALTDGVVYGQKGYIYMRL